ncbi:cation-translocating P-type ATPase [Gorillibacterium sp. CAU 1737]|uniref:heavy metal translocating P-type ATPase n=1 Tax=Gorillibacterium sp. CAU 1737 TaxID=3140362 RepID=UPI003260291D
MNIRRNATLLGAGSALFLGFALGQIGFEGAREGLLILATLVAGAPIARKAVQALRMRAFSIELLVSIASIGALSIREYSESSVVTFLFLFGAYLEARTLERTRSSLKKLLDQAPREAVVFRNGEWVTLAVDKVEKGDRILIKSGGTIPVDGKIQSGHASIMEAAITGEAIPVSKKAQDHVYSATLVDQGIIEIEAEKVGADSTYAKIIELVEEAQESKSRTVTFLDKFAAIYTPTIVGVSLLVYASTRNLHMAITFLVVACPGALVIGAPVSYVAGIGNGARHGVLIKGGEVMERLAKANRIMFDKTGTLTKGRPAVTDIQVFSDLEPDDLLKAAATAESISEHHLGHAIVREAERRGLLLSKESIRGDVVKGGGIRAIIEGRRIVLGSRRFLQEEPIAISEAALAYADQREKAGNTAVFFARDGQFAGILSIQDQIRQEAASAIAEMRSCGIKRFILLTGDNRHTAQLVAEELGLDERHAELLPEDKVAFVKKVQAEGHVVVMAGDGINDAPAIAAADVGVAMGEGGTDVAMETAGLVLMGDRLLQLSHAFGLAKATVRNMKQNTFFAVAMVIFLLAGVLTENIHLASGMFLHELSVLLVILNATRLVYYRGRQSVRRQSQKVTKPMEGAVG